MLPSFWGIQTTSRVPRINKFIILNPKLFKESHPAAQNNTVCKGFCEEKIPSAVLQHKSAVQSTWTFPFSFPEQKWKGKAGKAGFVDAADKS